DVGAASIEREVAVAHQLAGLLAGVGKPQAVDDVIQPRLEDLQQVLPGHAGPPGGLLEMLAELPLQDAVHRARLLLLAQLRAVLGHLASPLAVLAGRKRTPLDGTLGAEAALPLQE